jgi:hypothetical protein
MLVFPAVVVLGFVLGACEERLTEPGTQPAAPESPQALSTTVTGVLVGAGDIASCKTYYKDEGTAKLLANFSGTIFTLGDNAYPDGSTANYSCYNSSWGALKSRTRPVPGNHDYHVSSTAAPYFNYFGSRAGPAGKGWYSYNVGGWHIIALNSERSLSTQATWLKSDLAAHPAKCTLAYWHKPYFTSGDHHGPATEMRPLIQILYNAGADIVLSGHNHEYERFAPQDPSGKATSSGIRQFVVGTGGAELYGFVTPKPNSQVRHSGYGVLALTLYSDHYAYRFISVGSSWTDAGTGVCH